MPIFIWGHSVRKLRSSITAIVGRASALDVSVNLPADVAKSVRSILRKGEAHSVIWTLTGLVLPALTALAAIPLLLQRLGPERYGLLALAFSLTGVASLFDLGIGRAAIQLIATAQRQSLRGSIARGAVWMTTITGGSATLLYWLCLALGGLSWLKYSQSLAGEVLMAAALLGITIPLQASIATLRSLCEVSGRFREVAWVRVALGAGNFGGPLLAVVFVPHLVAAVIALVLVRIGAWVAYRTIANQGLRALCGELPSLDSDQRNVTKDLLRAGGWLSISGVVGPIMVQADKFFIASRLNVSDVSLYAIPSELVSQGLVFASALATVAYPLLARQSQDLPDRGWANYRRWQMAVGVLMGLLLAALALLLPHLLSLWLGNELSQSSVLVGQILCVGVFGNSLGLMAVAYLNALGAFRFVAMLHLVELVPFLGALFLIVDVWGIEGAAVVWSTRAVFDAVALMGAAKVYSGHRVRRRCMNGRSAG